MTTKRQTPFIWITWLAKVMAGEQSREWASWFKAHHENYKKAPSDFDRAKWRIGHTRGLRDLRQECVDRGERVFLEGENQIRYTLPSGVVVVGKPDLIAIRKGCEPTIYDIKTGQPRASNDIQVLLYMLLLPRAVSAYREARPDGCIVYPESRVEIPNAAVDDRFASDFEYFVNIISSEVPAMKAPSFGECRFCDIAKAECAERVES